MDELYAHQYQLTVKEQNQEMRLVTLWECPPVILNQALLGFLMGRLYLWYLITAVPKDIPELWDSFTFWLQSHYQNPSLSCIRQLKCMDRQRQPVLFGLKCCLGAIAMAIIVLGYRRIRSTRDDGYEPIVI